MSDRLCMLTRTPRRQFAAALAALAITAGAASVWAQNAPTQPAATTPAGTGKGGAGPVAPAPKLRSPRQMAEELVPILQKQKTPWQLYPTYEKIFTDFADQEMALAPPNVPNNLHARRAEQLRAMAALLAAMGEQAKIQTAIKRGQSTVAPEKRQSTLLDAGAELSRLLGEFVRQAATLPQSSPATRP